MKKWLRVIAKKRNLEWTGIYPVHSIDIIDYMKDAPARRLTPIAVQN